MQCSVFSVLVPASIHSVKFFPHCSVSERVLWCVSIHCLPLKVVDRLTVITSCSPLNDVLILCPEECDTPADADVSVCRFVRVCIYGQHPAVSLEYIRF